MMSDLRITAYLQHHPEAKSWQVARALGISQKTVYRNRVRHPERLPTWEVSDLALRIWLALGDSGTVANLLEDLGCSRNTFYRGLRELKSVGLAVSFRTQSGATVYRRLEQPMRDPFDVFSSPEEPEEFDPFARTAAEKPKTGSVAETADRFAEWAAQQWPSAPSQTNRKPMMAALSKARKENGVTAYQERTALEMWLSSGPSPKGHAPLWRQFLAAYPALVLQVPAAPPAAPVREDPKITARRKLERDTHEAVLEMARTLDRELKDRDYDTYFERYNRKALYLQRVSKGAPLADPWDPPLSASVDDPGDGGVVADHTLGGQTEEGGADAGEQDLSQFFEVEDTSVYFEQEDDSHQDAEV